MVQCFRVGCTACDLAHAQITLMIIDRRPVPISRIWRWRLELIGRTLVREVAAIQGEVVDAERLGQLGEPGLNQVGPHQAD